MSEPSDLHVLDWRRRVAGLYAEVRRLCREHPAAGHEAWRRGRESLFLDHPASPLLPDARARRAGPPVAPYDSDLRFELTVEPAEPQHLDVVTGTDGTAPFDRVGVVRLPGLGSLDVWWLGSYGGGVFVPLRDDGAGTVSYGGGRYLLDTVKGADLGGRPAADGEPATLVVDLNFAYHPSCAYDPAWACPLAPPGNVLDGVVDAGEVLPEVPWY